MKKIIRNSAAIVLLAFGLPTLFLSTSIILDLFHVREKEGNYVTFIVWANFACSILYLCSVYGFVKIKKWTTLLLALSSLVLIVAMIFLKVHIANGGAYETKTIGAMIFRIALSIFFTLISYFSIQKINDKQGQ